MFIRSSAAINDCLIALDCVKGIYKGENLFETQSSEDIISIFIVPKGENLNNIQWKYASQEARDKAFDELCDFLNTNYKLRDFT